MAGNSSSEAVNNGLAREKAQADKLAEELESLTGARQLGNEAYKTAKQDIAKRPSKS